MFQTPKGQLSLILVILLALMTIAVVAPMSTSASDVTVSDGGEDSVVINNTGSSNVTATVNGSMFSYNTTVEPGETVVVPAGSTENVSVHV